MENKKFCKYCGEEVNIDAVLCPKCGRQIEELKTEQTNSNQPIIINNNNNNNNNNDNNPAYVPVMGVKKCDKWVALLLCIFLGIFGAHKFYEGKIGLGLIYLFTMGLFGFGVLIDFIIILLRPNPYYV